MALPQSQEYNEAIQAPALCFTDPDLKRGLVRTNAMGLPVAVSGGFANVYEVAIPGSGSWAVRCFIREVQDQQRRYTEISNALTALRLPYTVQFQYQNQGIRVNGRLLPIVKMEWLRGSQLGDYVQKNVSDGRLMRELAEKWVTMVDALRLSNLAHGDLQHGNVLVVNHELKLIDYDGIYVKAFQGMRSNEVGHPNYQHPRRTENDFGLYTDNFSAWVVYASLRILAVAPENLGLARGLGRDECLLFNKEDFASPAMSPLLGSLKFHENETVARLTSQIEHLLTLSPRDIPPLDANPYKCGDDVVSIPVTGPSDWWKDPVQEKSDAASAAVEEANGRNGEIVPIEFAENSRAEKEVFAFMCSSVVAYFLLSGSMGYVGFGIVELVILLAMRLRLHALYLACPEAQQRERLFLEVASKHEELTLRLQRRDALKEKLPGLQERLGSIGLAAQKERAEATLRQGVEVKEAHTAAAIARSEMEKQIRDVDAEEARELVAAVGQGEREIAVLQTRVNEIDAQSARYLHEALEQYKKSSLRPYLATHMIAGSSIDGVGEVFKSKLASYGITTAADIDYGAVRRIRGFGPTRTAELMKWKERVAGRYVHHIPSVLPYAEIQRVGARLQFPRDEAAAKLTQAQQRVQSARQQVIQKFAVRKATLQQERIRMFSSAQKKLEDINQRYANKARQSQQDVEQLKRSLEKEISSSRLAQTNLEAEIRRIQIWHKGSGAKLRPYENINFEKFVRFVFFSPISAKKFLGK